jgi:hypothetical protein
MGTLLSAFRQTLTKIEELKRHVAAEQAEISTLEREIEELRSTLMAETTPKSSGEFSVVGRAVNRGRVARTRPIRQNSTVGLARRVLATAGGGPLHIEEIIRNIESMTGLPVNKQTLTSNLSRYCKARDTFRRTAPNTFELIRNDEQNEKEMRLVG